MTVTSVFGYSIIKEKVYGINYMSWVITYSIINGSAVGYAAGGDGPILVCLEDK